MPVTARNSREKLTPARKEKIVTIHITAGLLPDREVLLMEKPPVAMVVKAWLTAENHVRPARRRHSISSAVSAR
mgnify:CR=1 FL=1